MATNNSNSDSLHGGFLLSMAGLATALRVLVASGELSDEGHQILKQHMGAVLGRGRGMSNDRADWAQDYASLLQQAEEMELTIARLLGALDILEAEASPASRAMIQHTVDAVPEWIIGSLDEWHEPDTAKDGVTLAEMRGRFAVADSRLRSIGETVDLYREYFGAPPKAAL